MIKTGSQHIAMLKDGRQVYINGQLAGDVTEHPAFGGRSQSIGTLYDFQSRPDNSELMTFEVPEAAGSAPTASGSCRTAIRSWWRGAEALEAWAELHGGFLGRAPDHVASCISGMYMGLDVFEAYDAARAGALADYYRFCPRQRPLSHLCHHQSASRPLQGRERAAGSFPHRRRRRSRTAKGITIRGAKMLATGGIMANEVLVTCIQPLREGDERYAVSFAVPMNAKGLKILSRKSYEESARSVFDNPLASRFDENDAVLYFDDVKVPWERVFVNQDIAMCQKQFHATPAHVYPELSVRRSA